MKKIFLLIVLVILSACSTTPNRVSVTPEADSDKVLKRFGSPQNECDGLVSDADVKICLGFNNLANCTVGNETQCLLDNGIAAIDIESTHNFKIKAGTTAEGSGKIEGASRWGTTGPGFVDMAIPGAPYQTVNMRWYEKYSEGRVSYNFDHSLGVKGSGGGCVVGGTTETSPWLYTFYSTGTGCPFSTILLAPNVASPVLENNYWHRWEIQRKMDTNCPGLPSNSFGCNGEFRMWIDGIKVMQYTNLSQGGVGGAGWNRIWGPRSYFHVGEPPWGKVEIDGIVVKVNMASNAQIGAAANESVDLGTKDVDSPYLSYTSIEPFLGRHGANDCSVPSGYSGVRDSIIWGSGGTRVSSPVLPTGYGFVDQCSPAQSKKAFQVSLNSPNSKGGFYWPRQGGTGQRHTFPSQSIHGFINLNAANDYSSKPALAGFADYANVPANGCSDSLSSNWLALSGKDGKFAVGERQCSTQFAPVITAQTNVTIPSGEYVEFEIMVKPDNTFSLALDTTYPYYDGQGMEWVIEDHPTTYNVQWMFNSEGSNQLVVGVIEYLGSTPFVVTYADISAGSASWWSCKGWNSASCPFSSSEPEPEPEEPLSGGGLFPWIQ